MCSAHMLENSLYGKMYLYIDDSTQASSLMEQLGAIENYWNLRRKFVPESSRLHIGLREKYEKTRQSTTNSS